MIRTRTGNRRCLPAAERKARRRARLVSGLRLALHLVAVLTVIVATFSGVVAGYLWLTTTPELALREVRFTGNRRTPLSALAEVAGLKPGTNLFLVDLEGVEARLRRLPWIRAVDARREWPHGLSVTVVEYRARAMVVHGGIYLVDAQGRPFKRWDPASDPRDLPVVSGIDAGASGARLEAEIRDALAVLDRWRSRKGRRAVAEVHVDAVRGYSLTLAEDEKHPPLVLHLGRDALEARMRRSDRLLALLDARGETPKELFVEGHTRPQWVVARVE